VGLQKNRAKKRTAWCKDSLIKWNEFSHVNILKELIFAAKHRFHYLRIDEGTHLEILALAIPEIRKSRA
jgi:hypothetical protein